MLFPQAGAVIVILMMVGATCVHLVFDDPDVFPLQPKKPLIPFSVIDPAPYILGKARPRTVTV